MINTTKFYSKYKQFQIKSNMKKKLFGSIAVLAVAALTAFNVNVNSQENGLSDVSLENVEALAYELPEATITCGRYTGRCWRHCFYFSGSYTITCEFTGRQSDHCA